MAPENGRAHVAIAADREGANVAGSKSGAHLSDKDVLFAIQNFLKEASGLIDDLSISEQAPDLSRLTELVKQASDECDTLLSGMDGDG